MDLLNETVLLKAKRTLFALFIRDTSQFQCYERLLNMTYVAYKRMHFSAKCNSGRISYQVLFRLSVYKIPAVYLSGAKNVCFCTIRDFGSPTIGHVMVLYSPGWTNIGFSFILLTVNLFRHLTLIERGLYKLFFSDCKHNITSLSFLVGTTVRFDLNLHLHSYIFVYAVCTFAETRPSLHCLLRAIITKFI